MQRAEMVQKHNGRHIPEQNFRSFFRWLLACYWNVLRRAMPASTEVAKLHFN